MARPHSYAKRRRWQRDHPDEEYVTSEDEDEVDEDGRKIGPAGLTASLPVANLPDDFEGEAEDGATYLALAIRANSTLPNFTRAPNPYRRPTPPPPVIPTSQPFQAFGAPYSPSAPVHSASAGPSRHPALPHPAWVSSFAESFQQQRLAIRARWPPSPPLRYPPDYPPTMYFNTRPDCSRFINGHDMSDSKRNKSLQPKGRAAKAEKAKNYKGKQKEPDSGDISIEMEDEEAMFNAGVMADVQPSEDDHPVDDATQTDTPATGSIEPKANGDAEPEVSPQEPDEQTNGTPYRPPRLTPREPLVSVLQCLSTYQLIRILDAITYQISGNLEPLESTLLPTQPDPADGDDISLCSDIEDYAPPPPRKKEMPPPNPYPTWLAGWVFAVLSVLEDTMVLSGDDISKLRELARAAMRVGGWRWVKAVLGGEITRSPADPGGGGENGNEGGGNESGITWNFGQRWRNAMDKQHDVVNGNLNGSEGSAGPPQPIEFSDGRVHVPGFEETGLDETLARCWMTVHAIAVGFAQKDLLEDLETLFK